MKNIKLIILLLILFLFPVFTFAKEKYIEVKINDSFSKCALTENQFIALDYLLQNDVIVKVNYSGGTSYATEHLDHGAEYDYDLTNSDGKVLFNCDSKQYCNVCDRVDNITDSDNIVYRFTDEEKEDINNSSDFDAMAFKGYDGIKIIFTPTVTNELDYIYNITEDDTLFSLPTSFIECIVSGEYNRFSFFTEIKIKNSQDELLSNYAGKAFLNNNGTLSVVECRGDSDIIYNLTQADKDRLYNYYGISSSPYNKVVLNYSGTTYGDDVLSFNMRDNSTINSTDFFKAIMFFSEKNLIKLNADVSFIDNANTQYAKLLFTTIYDMKSIYTTKLTIPQSRQLIINVDEIPSGDRYLPQPYQRVIFNFVKGTESGNSNVVPSSKPNNISINNPKTGRTIMAICLVIAMSAVSLLIINIGKIKKNNA